MSSPGGFGSALAADDLPERRLTSEDPEDNVAATPSDDTAWFTSARKCTSSGDSVTSSITGMAFAFAARRVTGRGRGVQRCNTPVDGRFCTGLYDSPDGQGFLEAPKFHYKGNIPSSLLRIIFGMLEADSSPMRTSFTLGTSVSVAIVSQYYLTTRSADTSYIDTSISRARIENIALQLNSEYVFSS
jgi:hypothetical protein